MDTKTPEDFQSLSEKKKIIKLEKALIRLKKVGNIQQSLLKNHASSNVKKEIGYLYFLKTVLYTWENIDFALSLGKGKNRHFNVYPTRTVCENVFRIEHYVSQKVKEQNEICFWEIARISARFYKEYGDQSFKDSYDGMVRDIGEEGLVYPDITEKAAFKDPFPNMKDLMASSKLPNTKNFYHHYQFLCESHHGKLLSIVIGEEDMSQYRRNLMYNCLFAKWLLMLTDHHIQGVTKKEVDIVIKEVGEIILSI